MSLGNDMDWGEVVTDFNWKIPMPEYVFKQKLLDELKRIADALEDIRREGKSERA